MNTLSYFILLCNFSLIAIPPLDLKASLKTYPSEYPFTIRPLTLTDEVSKFDIFINKAKDRFNLVKQKVLHQLGLKEEQKEGEGNGDGIDKKKKEKARSIAATKDYKNFDLLVVTENFPPFNYEESGKIVGSSAEKIHAMFEAASRFPKIHVYPWSKSYHLALTRPNVLIFSLARTEEREDKFIWLGKLANSNSYIYQLKGNKNVEEKLPINNYEDLKQSALSIAVTRNDVRHNLLIDKGFKVGLHLNISSQQDICLNKILKKEVDLWAVPEATMNYIARKAGIENPESYLSSVLEMTEIQSQIYVAMSLGSDPRLVNQFKSALETAEQEGFATSSEDDIEDAYQSQEASDPDIISIPDFEDESKF